MIATVPYEPRYIIVSLDWVYSIIVVLVASCYNI